MPTLDCLEERVLLANYYWRPNANLAVNLQSLTSTAGNWKDGPGGNANVYQQAPRENDTLFFDANSTRSCYIDEAASAVFAAINDTLPDGLRVFVTKDINFSGGGQNAASFIGGTIRRDINQGYDTIRFSGSPVVVTRYVHELRANRKCPKQYANSSQPEFSCLRYIA